MKASVVVLTYNRWEWTELTLNSLFKNTFFPHELIVVDNHSTDGTVEKLKQLKRDGKINTLILLPKNCGGPAGFNIGWKISDHNHWFAKVDNDVKLSPHWLRRMCLLASQKGIGLVGTAISMRLRQRAKPLKVHTLQDIKFVYVYWTVAGIAVFSKATLNKIGYEREDLGKGEQRFYCISDTEYVERARTMGLKNAYILNLDCWHIPELLARQRGILDSASRTKVEREKYPEYRRWKERIAKVKRHGWFSGKYPKWKYYETWFTKKWIKPYIFEN